MTAEVLSLWIVTLVADGNPDQVGGFILGPCDAKTAMHETLRRRPDGWQGQIMLEPAEVSELKPIL